MTPNQIALVQGSFAHLAPQADAFAADFYRRLFTLAPKLRVLFPVDMGPQRKKLVVVLGTAINSLEEVETIVPALRDLGARHVDYGVEPQHYDQVGRALLDALATAMGDGWSVETAAAWTTLYAVVSQSMQSGATDATNDQAA